MFGLFKKKSEKDKLMDRYRQLLEEAHRLSSTDRRASDLKAAEAEALIQRIQELNK